MKKRFLLLFTILSFHGYSQISFEKGYYITNNNQKIECLIKNLDWKYNPDQFEFKLSENSEIEIASITAIKEFGIDNVSKYIRSKVNIDQSSEDIDKLSTEKEPLFKEDVLFLKVLIEGKASLYVYNNRIFRRYFYSIDNTNIEQLIYKSYVTADNKIGENNKFKTQLWNNLKCPDIEVGQLRSLDYKKKKLANLFIKYNSCVDEGFINYENKQKKIKFNLSIRPGFKFSNSEIQNTITNSIYSELLSNSKLTFRFGVEAEFIMPFNKNKWALVVEPTYQYFNSKISEELNDEIDYKSIELPIGIRHYFFLNEDSKLFINGFYVYDFSFDSSIQLETSADLDINTVDNFAFGIGYKFKEKYSIEFRYQTSRDLVTYYFNWVSDFNSASVIFGYSLF